LSTQKVLELPKFIPSVGLARYLFSSKNLNQLTVCLKCVNFE